MMRLARSWLVLLAGWLLLVQVHAGVPVMPQYAADKHLGPASCASTQCHGAVTPPEKQGNIPRNEYRVWLAEEKAHANAYAVLKSKRSKLMAKRLGLKNAHEAKICLDCHADNVPEDKRGRKFRLTQGVGCEACHGGAERWVKSHTEKGATHADNVRNGLYPLDEPSARAAVCLSCHYGDEHKFATHDLMAAGHPRMNIELDTQARYLKHFEVDEDYLKRKTYSDGVQFWVAGMAQYAKLNLAVMEDLMFRQTGVFPEIALFDCHACHHAMDDKRIGPRITTTGLPPGAVRINDSVLTMLYVISQQLSPAESDALLSGIHQLHRATLQDSAAVKRATTALAAVVDRVQARVLASKIDDKTIRGLRKSLLALGAKGEFRDYSAAEQVAEALDILTFELQEDEKFNAELERLFAAIESESDYRPADFRDALRRFSAAVGQ